MSRLGPGHLVVPASQIIRPVPPIDASIEVAQGCAPQQPAAGIDPERAMEDSPPLPSPQVREPNRQPPQTNGTNQVNQTEQQKRHGQREPR